MNRIRTVFSPIAGRFAAAAVFALALFPAAQGSAPAQPSGEGMLSIVTVPSRAEVWIDNKYAGLSPVRQKRLNAGTYTLRLVDPSQQASATEIVSVQAGEHLFVEKTLSARFGKLRVDTDPPGAGVAIVAELGKTPLVNDFINPGIYKIEIRHPRSEYKPVIEEVTFADGQPVAISHKLKKPPLFTKKRGAQLALGTAAAAGFTWAIIEQGKSSSSRQKAELLKDASPKDAEAESKKSRQAGVRRTAAVISAATLSVGLQVTIFIW